jgi:hypothetical protein
MNMYARIAEQNLNAAVLMKMLMMRLAVLSAKVCKLKEPFQESSYEMKQERLIRTQADAVVALLHPAVRVHIKLWAIHLMILIEVT